MNFFLSKLIYSRVVHPFLFPRRPHLHVAWSVNQGKGAPIPGVRAAPSSCAPLVHKRGVGDMPPSYSHADPVWVSPQGAGWGEGALLGVHGPRFLCPPCMQTGGRWHTPFLFPHNPHSHVTPACRRGGVGTASGFAHSPQFALHLVHKAQTRARVQMGKGAPLPIPTLPPVCVSALHQNRGWGGLHVAPGLRVPFVRGRGCKGGGAPLLGLRMPRSRRHCAQGGRGGADSHSCVGPRFVGPMCMQGGAGGGAPLPFAWGPPCSSCALPWCCAPCPHRSFALPFRTKGAMRRCIPPSCSHALAPFPQPQFLRASTW